MTRVTGAVIAASQLEETGVFEALPGLPVPGLEEADWETMVSSWLEIHQSIQGHLWAMGKIAATVETRYGEQSIVKFAAEVGYSPRRVWEFAQTYKAWANMRPSQILSFQHHTIALRGSDPETVIQQAEDNQLSTRQLAQAIHEEEEPNAVEKVESIVCPRCGGDGVVPVES